MKQFIKFGVVGGIGFIVDASILLFLVNILIFDIAFSRACSFSCAVFVTWLINRKFTFEQSSKYSKSKEYFIYFFIQIFGALINFIIFILLVNNIEFMKKILIIPLFIGSIFSLIFNFFCIKRGVYLLNV